ncbi:MAG: carbamoyltransferase [Planctomycetota bacterium]
MTSILGISAFYHDSAAALIRDGEIVAAAQEERFTRNKHDHVFPQKAVDFCLQHAGLEPEEIDYVGFYEKPLTKFERLLETYLAVVPAGYPSFRRAMPLWLKQKLHLPRELSRGLRNRYTGRYVFTDHHESHAASAFFPSPFEEAAILTIDGVGEWSTTCLGIGRGNKIELTDELTFPHSLGLLYSAFTYYLGFRVNSGEYKVMGLAPFGEPKFHEQILKEVMDLKSDGSFRMDMSYFNYCQGLTMTSSKFHRLFGGPPRTPESEITQHTMDVAASIQSVVEEVMLRMAKHLHDKTGMKHLVLAGGVALNCVGNGRILRESPFEDLWVQPAAGDAGGALGAAMFVWHQLLQKPRTVNESDHQSGSLLGPEFADEEIAQTLKEQGANYTTYDSDEQLCQEVAKLIADQQVIGWFQGRMEFGPRALGARSILADARSATTQFLVNVKIKFRESFRPFAPIVLSEHAHKFFELSPQHESPYMLLVAPVQEAIRVELDGDETRFTGTKRVQACRSLIPAVTHVDHSARIQTVDKNRNPLIRKLLESFYELTECPVLINTSFNVRSEPIVCTPDDAYQCFMNTDMDVLVLGHHVLLKDEQPSVPGRLERAEHLSRFKLD